MNLLLLFPNIAGITPKKDTSFAIALAAQAMHINLYYAEPSNLFLETSADTSAKANAADLTIQAAPLKVQDTQREQLFYTLGARTPYPATHFDAILIRTDPPFDSAYLYTTQLLQYAANKGAKVYNPPHILQAYNEKLAAFHFAPFMPATLVSQDTAAIAAFLATHQDIVVKPLDGFGGQGIFRLKASDPNTRAILETFQGAHIVAQAYLPDIAAGDKRILIVDGEVMPYLLARHAADGETRANLAAGGQGVARELTANEYAIAAPVAAWAKAHDLLLVGLDVIGDKITEVNLTSPTCMREIAAQTGFDIAERVCGALLKKTTENRAR